MLRFYGASDDLVEVDGVFREEFNLPGNNELDLVIHAPDGTPVFGVFAKYGKNGIWVVAPVMLDEDIGIPYDWAFTTFSGADSAPGAYPGGYTMVLLVTGVTEGYYVAERE